MAGAVVVRQFVVRQIPLQSNPAAKAFRVNHVLQFLLQRALAANNEVVLFRKELHCPDKHGETFVRDQPAYGQQDGLPGEALPYCLRPLLAEMNGLYAYGNIRAFVLEVSQIRGSLDIRRGGTHNDIGPFQKPVLERSVKPQE